MESYTVQKLIEASPINVKNLSEQEYIDELCSHMYTTIGSSQSVTGRNDEYTFKIESVNINNNPHTISTRWYVQSGEKVTSMTDNSKGECNKYLQDKEHPIDIGMIELMKSSQIK